MDHKKILNARRKTVQIAVATALPMLMGGGNAYAACTAGSSPATDVNTVTCTEGSTYTNPAGTTVTNSATIANAGNTASLTNSVVQLIGNGNTFSNAGTITNAVTYSNTATKSGQFFGVYMGAVPGTDDTALNKMTNSGTISATIGAANFTLLGASAARINTIAVVGLGTDAEGEYTLTNGGTISATHFGVGRVNGVEAGGDVEQMTITNSGTITGTAANVITKTASTATSFQGTTTAFGTAESIGVAAGIYAEEEVKNLNVINAGTITGTGTYASGIYTRAGITEIENKGTVTGTRMGVAMVSDTGITSKLTLKNSGTISGDVLSVNGSALRWWSLSNSEGTSGATIDSRLNINSQYGQADSTIANSGTINGKIYLSNGTHKLTNEKEGSITGAIDVDQRDTVFTSTTTCNVGDTGNHCWDAAATVPTLTGVQKGSEFQSANLKVNVTGITTTGGTFGRGVITFTPTVMGTKNFTFENAGTFNSDIIVRTATGTLADGTSIASKITLIPTITGSGVGKALADPSTNIAGTGATLKIYDGTAATDGSNSTATLATIAPKSLVTVHRGEYFKVADNLYGSTLPVVQSDSLLVKWSIDKNAAGNLVLGVDSVAGAAILGLNARNTAVIDALMSSNSAIGAVVEGFTSAKEIDEAAEQLRPEINGANIQAAINVTDKVFGLVDSHLNETHLAQLTGKSGISTGEQPNGIGVWLQGFGFRGDQDRRKNVDGYTADAYGFAIGADTLVGNDKRMGAAFSYGQSNIDDKGVNNGNKVDIDSYQAMLYGSMLMNSWYLNGTLGLGKHNYDSKRIVLGNVINGSHDAWQYTAKVDAGWPLKVGTATITPVAALTYSRLNEQSYTESGVGALSVGSVDTDSFRAGLGAKALIPLSEGKVKTALELRAIWNHEFADTAQDTTASFVGGSTFRTSGVTRVVMA